MTKVFVILRFKRGSMYVLLDSGRWSFSFDDRLRTFPTRAAAIAYRRANFPGHWEMNVKPFFYTAKVNQYGYQASSSETNI